MSIGCVATAEPDVGGAAIAAGRRGRGLILASALMAALVLLLLAPSRSAASEAVLRTGESQAAWGFLENEAEAVLASQGLSNQMSQTQDRGLIRSYVLLRLVGAIDNPHPSMQEQGALNFLKSRVIQEQYYSAFNAGQTWNDWVSSEFDCPNGDLTKWLVWEGGNAACGFWQLFGKHPHLSSFNSAGYDNVWNKFSEEGQAAHALSDMVAGTSYWGGVASNLPPNLAGEARTAAEQAHEVFEGEFETSVKEVLIDLASSVVDTITEGAPGPADLIPLGIATGVILSDAAWNAYEVGETNEDLTDEINATNPANNPPAPDLSRLAKSPGITELAYIVASQTLDGLTTETLPCSFNGSAGNNLCYTYTFGTDPDFEQATYASTPTPLPNQSTPEAETEPFFELTEVKGPNTGATCDSPSVEPPATCGTASLPGAGAMPMWQTQVAVGGSTASRNADVTSARGVLTDGLYDGYTSFIHHGMFVTRSVGYPSDSPYESSWLYRPSISYEAPDKTRWAAWYQNGSFLQTKLAAPLAGSVYTGYQSSDRGGICEEAYTWEINLYEPGPTGNLCLFQTTESATGGQQTIESLEKPSSGNELMVLGARVEVKAVAGCWQNDAAYDFNGQRCSGNGKAAVLYPEQSKIGPAFELKELVNDLIGIGKLSDPYTFGPQDSSAWVVTHSNTCAGREASSCQSPSSDIANCNLPVTVNPSEPWSKTTCFRGSAITYTAADSSVWQAQVIVPPAAVPQQYTADADNAAFSCCTNTKLVVSATEGLFANASGTGVSTSAPASNISVKVVQQPANGTLTFNKKNGSFNYLPNSGFGWSGPAKDTFTYEICNSSVPSWERQCSQEQTATITVRQAPPTVAPVDITSNIGSPAPGTILYIHDYKYFDRQETPEGVTSIAWYSNGQPTHITGPEFRVGAGLVGDTITAVVSTTAQDGTQGKPTTSNGLQIIGQGPYSYTAYPNYPGGDKLTCTPTPLYFPANPPMTTTCTATVTVTSLTQYITGAAKAAGKVTFRSTTPGTFDSSSCTLAQQSFVKGPPTGTTISSCAVKFTPTQAGGAGVVGAFAYSIPIGGQRGTPGGFGGITDYQTANVPVGQSGPGGAVRFVVTGLTNTAGGTPQSVTVAAIDGYGNPTPGYTGTVHFTSNDQHAVLPADYTFTPADQGKHTFTGITLNTAISKGTTVTATDTTLPAIAGSQAATISVGSPATFVISGFKYTTQGGVAAGSSQKATITVQDIGGNVVTGYTGTVHFTSSDSQATLPADYTFTSADQGKHTLATGELVLKTVSNATVGVTDGTISGSAKVTVDAAATSQFKIALAYPAQPVTAGEARTFVITPTDAYGNITQFYTGSVTFTSTDGQATLPATYTFTDTGSGGDYGMHEFEGVVLRTVGGGQQTLEVTEVGHTKVKGTVSVPIQPAATASLKVSTPAATGGAVAGTPQDLTVTAVDAYGNTTPSYNGLVLFTSSDKKAALPQNYGFQGSDAGVHKFSHELTLKTAGSQTIIATDWETSTITGSQSVSVTAGAAAKLGLSGLVSGPPGAAQTLTVSALDQFGNETSKYIGTVAFTSTDPAAALPANYTFTAADGGQHQFTSGVTLKTLGSQTVTAKDVVSKAISGSESVGVGSTRFAVSSGTLTEGQPGAVAVRDYAASDSMKESGTLPPGVTFTASLPGGGTSAGEGEAIFSGTPQSGSAGTYPVTLSVHSSSPALEYTETFTLTVQAPTHGVSLQSSSSSVGATRVEVQVGFTAAHGVPQGGQITVLPPVGLTWGGLKGLGGVLTDTVNVYDNGQFAHVESPMVSPSGGGRETLVVPVEGFSIGSGDHIALDISDVINPTAPTAEEWAVATSTDQTPVPVGSQSFAEKNGVAPFSATAGPATAKAIEVWYEETFVMPDELRATDYQNFSLFAVPGGEAQSTITLTAPAGASFPNGCPHGYLTDATNLFDSQQLRCLSVNGNKVTYYLEYANVPAGDDVTLFEEGGATNPSTAGANQISVATSADPEPIAVAVEITKK